VRDQGPSVMMYPVVLVALLLVGAAFRMRTMPVYLGMGAQSASAHHM